jgi:hypothetical protein
MYIELEFPVAVWSPGSWAPDILKYIEHLKVTINNIEDPVLVSKIHYKKYSTVK